MMTTAINPPCEVCGEPSCQTSYPTMGTPLHYCAKHGIGLTGINADYIAALTAERDALKAELAGQAWTMRDMEDQLAALRAQVSPDAVDETMDVSQIAVNVAYKVNATRVHELGGDSLTIFKEPELLAFVREVYAALKHSHD